MNRTFASLISPFALMALLVLLVPGAPAQAASSVITKNTSAPFEVSGWIPYWRTEAGTADVMPNLKSLTEVNPFGFTVTSSGQLYDAMGIQKKEWKDLQKASKANKVRYIPTVMWSDTAAIHTVLSDPTLRTAHVQSIVKAVNDYNLDGIDIDYEAKMAEDRDNFSAFLRELSQAFSKRKMNKWLMCTIESRMPLEARYSGAIPAGIEYANDLKAINRYCDRVRIMTYDQQTADVQLNKANRGKLYAPVSDVAWVEKVVNYMAQDIDKKKMVIGIPTYGYIYQVMPKTDGSGYDYIKTEAFNPRYATQIAAQYGITPTRNAAGELSFTYVPKETSPLLPNNALLSRLAPKGTASGNLAAAGALALAKEKRQQAPVQLLWWSDAKAIEDKVKLAKKLGVRGVAVFKFDGGQDPGMWKVLR